MKTRGFTLIEILIGIALLAILLALVVAAINPAARFQDARNTQRFSDVTAIMDAINLNMLDNNGVFLCSTGPLPTSSLTNMANTGGYNICPCIAGGTPTSSYIASVPSDPSATGAQFTDCTDYDTQYRVQQADLTLVITVDAPEAVGDGESDGVSISR